LLGTIVGEGSNQPTSLSCLATTNSVEKLTGKAGWATKSAKFKKSHLNRKIWSRSSVRGIASQFSKKKNKREENLKMSKTESLGGEHETMNQRT